MRIAVKEATIGKGTPNVLYQKLTVGLPTSTTAWARPSRFFEGWASSGPIATSYSTVGRNGNAGRTISREVNHHTKNNVVSSPHRLGTALP